MVLNFIKSGYKKVKDTLTKTGSLLGNQLNMLFKGNINEASLESLEQILYAADLGTQTARELTQSIRKQYQQNPKITSEEVILQIRKHLVEILNRHPTKLIEIPKEKSPLVVMIVGVNGNGKTTSVAKLAKRFKESNNQILLAAADTFRAAATEQLSLWAERLQIEIVKGTAKSDPSSVVFDAITAGKARKADIVLVDTAGRLHTKIPLMQELEKIKRTCKKIHPDSPHEVLLVLDATTGQNAIDQAITFNEYIPITGLILTKLDGTAKGGVVINICRKLNIPVKFIGIGEGIDDLESFDAEAFVTALL